MRINKLFRALSAVLAAALLAACPPVGVFASSDDSSGFYYTDTESVAVAGEADTAAGTEAVAAAGETEIPVEIKAKAAVLMDVTTGKVLLAQNENEPVYPASVTKIMPLLLVMEALDSGKINLSDTVSVTAEAASKGGSQIWLKEGETMTVDELLRATAIYSANDACTALGEYIAGSNEAFVAMLNSRAEELGMTNTHFDNCTGLDDDTDTHLTTAMDVALMSRELLGHELITDYTTVWMDSLRGGETQLVNTNKLVRFYSGTTGLKTGTTNKAGCCVSASAQREGTHLIAVVMGSDTSDERFSAAKAMLNWGFASFDTVTPPIDASAVTPVKIIRGDREYITPAVPQTGAILIKKGSADKIEQSVELAADVQAPVEAGQALGKVKLTLDGETVGEYLLTAPEGVEKMTVGKMLRRVLAALV